MILHIDYDSHRGLTKGFTRALFQLKNVYNSKRTYEPYLHVDRVVKTQKGYHLYICYRDRMFDALPLRLQRAATLLLQYHFNSDKVRGLFDLIRIARNREVYNLLFDYKNGYLDTEDLKMKDALNLEIARVMLYKKKRKYDIPNFKLQRWLLKNVYIGKKDIKRLANGKPK